MTQTCIVHLLRNSFRYAARQDWDAVAKALKPVYTAPTEAAAKERFTEFAEVWGARYPAIVRLWDNAWAEFVPFPAFDTEIRRVICSTNAIESVNARIRRAVKARGHFPNDQAGWIQPVNATLLISEVLRGCWRSTGDSGRGSAGVLGRGPVGDGCGGGGGIGRRVDHCGVGVVPARWPRDARAFPRMPAFVRCASSVVPGAGGDQLPPGRGRGSAGDRTGTGALAVHGEPGVGARDRPSEVRVPGVGGPGGGRSACPAAEGEAVGGGRPAA